MPFGGLLTVGLIGAAGSLAGGAVGASGAKGAAATEANAAKQAQSNIQAAGATANQGIENVLGQQENLLSPYTTAGANGLNALSGALAPGGSLTSQFNWNPASIAQDPGYQAQLALGTQAVQRAAAASGTLDSGGTLKALTQYAQGVTAGYENQDYTQALNSFNTNRANTIQNLTLPIQIGQYGTSGLLSSLQNYGNLYSSNTLGVAGQANNYLTQGASATAAGQVGAANSFSSALGSITNLAQFLGLANTLGVNGGGLANSSGTNGAITIGPNGNVVPYTGAAPAPAAVPAANVAPSYVPSAFPNLSGYFNPSQVYGAPAVQ